MCLEDPTHSDGVVVVVVVLTSLAEKILQILPANVEWELEIAKIINTHAFVDGTIS